MSQMSVPAGAWEDLRREVRARNPGGAASTTRRDPRLFPFARTLLSSAARPGTHPARGSLLSVPPRPTSPRAALFPHPHHTRAAPRRRASSRARSTAS